VGYVCFGFTQAQRRKSIILHGLKNRLFEKKKKICAGTAENSKSVFERCWSSKGLTKLATIITSHGGHIRAAPETCRNRFATIHYFEIFRKRRHLSLSDFQKTIKFIIMRIRNIRWIRNENSLAHPPSPRHSPSRFRTLYVRHVNDAF